MAERTAASELPASLVRLIQASAPGARLVSARALGADEELVDSSHKGAGYGAPLLLELETSSGTSRWVLHTATANPFGHDRRADRAAEMLLAYDTFGEIPRHARVIDVGAYLRDGGSCSLADSGEFYLLTEWLTGSPYAHDLRAIGERARRSGSQSLTPRERRRAQNLARYLAALHASQLTVPSRETTYRRAVRDLLGSGEGLFGILDGYPDATPAAPPERLDAIERRALEYRSKLRTRTARLARIHGDFHPFNILFDDGDEPRLLDASRGCAGDPADDVVCLTVNYLFFGLLFEPAACAFEELFQLCFRAYFEERPDPELLEVAPPYLAWRALVLANPTWYPEVDAGVRDRLLGFVEQTLEARALSLESARALLVHASPGEAHATERP